MGFVVEFSECVQELAKLPVAPLKDVPVAASWDGLMEAVSEALGRGETHYTDRPGILPLRQKSAALLNERFGLAIDAKADVVVTCGIVEARFVTLQQLLQPGAAVWASDAMEERVAGAALLRRAKIVGSAKEAKLVYLASSLGEAALREALATVSAEALVLFEVDDESGAFHPAKVESFADRTITIGQLGDAAWQMGYLASPSRLSAGVRDFKQALTICSTNLSQWAMLAGMEA